MSTTRRPRSVIGLTVVLFVIAVLSALNLARVLVGYFGSGGGAAQVSVVEVLLVPPQQVLLPTAIGLLAAISGVGVLGGRPWGRVLAIVVGSATLLGGAILLWSAMVELGVPGSFSVLLLPPAIVALLIGAYVLYAAIGSGPDSAQ